MDPTDSSWLDRAGAFAGHKMRQPDQLQGLALLAVAEAIHRHAADQAARQLLPAR